MSLSNRTRFAALSACGVLFLAGLALAAGRTDQVPPFPADMSPAGLRAAASQSEDPSIYEMFLPVGAEQEVSRFVAETRAMGVSKRSSHLIAAAPFNVRANDPTGDRIGETQAEVAVAMYGDTVVVGWNDAQGFIGTPITLTSYAYSTNGGVSYTDGGSVPLALAGDQAFGDAGLDTDEQGYWYLNEIYTRTGQQNIGVHRGRFVAGVLVWNVPIMASIGTSATGNLDKCLLAADRVTRNVYVAYTRFSATSRIEIVRSTTNGATWDPAIILDGTTTPTSSKTAARPFCGPAGEVYVVWEKGANSILCPDGSGNVGSYNSAQIAFSRSLDFGATFSALSVVGTGTLPTTFMWSGPGDLRERGNDFPDIAVDRSGGPYNGRIYVTWHQSGNWTANLNAGPVKAEAADAANNNPGGAELFNVGDNVTGSISSTADFDYWQFSATQGQALFFNLDPQGFNCGVSGTTRGMRLRLFAAATPYPNPTGFPDSLLAASAQGTFAQRIVWTCPQTGNYLLRLQTSTTAIGTYVLRVRDLTFTPSPARDARDVIVVSSANQGASWTAEARVNDDPAGLENRRPFISVDGNGHVHCFWHDSRVPGLGSTAALTSVFGTTSRDGGATWTPNYRVNDELSFFSFNTLGVPNLGDYNQAASSGNCTVAGWSDQRLSTGDVRTPGTNTYSAGRGPDAYTAKVCFAHTAGCAGTVVLPRGVTSPVQFCVTNTGTVPDTYSYTVLDDTGWIVTGSGTLGPLDPGVTACINVDVQVPPTCPGGADHITWSVTPVGDAAGGTRTCVTTIMCEPTVPVLVSDFGAQLDGSTVAVSWTATDLQGIRGWNLYRGLTLEGTATRVNAELVGAAGSSHFTFRDPASDLSGTVYYRLAALRDNGVEESIGTINVTIQASPRRVAFALAGSNPFGSRTAFSYSLPQSERVRIEVFNVAGQRVLTLVDRVSAPGVYTVTLDLKASGVDLGAGVYMVKMRAGSIERSLRIVSVQ